MGTILHITDAHLLDTHNDWLSGVLPAATLQLILNQAKKHFPNPKHIIWTGDLIHSESETGHGLFRELIGDWSAKSLFLPGNHENRKLMRTYFPEIPGKENQRMSHTILFNGWLLLLLDSRVDGETFGALSPEDITMISNIIHKTPNIPTLIVLHHPPITTNTIWINQHILRNNKALADALKHGNKIKPFSLAIYIVTSLETFLVFLHIQLHQLLLSSTFLVKNYHTIY